jgi:hypothetical protein
MRLAVHSPDKNKNIRVLESGSKPPVLIFSLQRDVMLSEVMSEESLEKKD